MAANSSGVRFWMGCGTHAIDVPDTISLYELHDSIEHPALLRAQSGRRSA